MNRILLILFVGGNALRLNNHPRKDLLGGNIYNKDDQAEDAEVLAGRLWDRFWSNEGVVMQMLECGKEEVQSLARCFDQKIWDWPIASIQRWDLPAVTFNHARQYGIILKSSVQNLNQRKVRASIRDASCKSQCFETSPNYDKKRYPPCDTSKSTEEWVRDVLFADTYNGTNIWMKPTPTIDPDFWKGPQNEENGKKKDLVKGPHHLTKSVCYFDSFEKMMDSQHAVLEQIYQNWRPELQNITELQNSYRELQCFYNQVALSPITVDDIEAVFYNNHTSGKQFVHDIKGAEHGGHKPVDMDFHGQRVYHEALELQEHLRVNLSKHVPLLQFQHQDDECWSPSEALKRVHSFDKQATTNYFGNFFQVPPAIITPGEGFKPLTEKEIGRIHGSYNPKDHPKLPEIVIDINEKTGAAKIEKMELPKGIPTMKQPKIPKMGQTKISLPKMR